MTAQDSTKSVSGHFGFIARVSLGNFQRALTLVTKADIQLAGFYDCKISDNELFTSLLRASMFLKIGL